LRLEPRIVDVVGQPRVRKGRGLGIAKSSYWLHELENPSPTSDFEDFLWDIATRLRGRAAFLERLVADGGEAEIFIGYFQQRSNTGFVLTANLQRLFADLHLDLSFDIYDSDEVDDVASPIDPSLLDPSLPSQGRE